MQSKDVRLLTDVVNRVLFTQQYLGVALVSDLEADTIGAALRDEHRRAKEAEKAAAEPAPGEQPAPLPLFPQAAPAAE